MCKRDQRGPYISTFTFAEETRESLFCYTGESDMIIDHTSPYYQRPMTAGKYNGAWYYSEEIVKNIIPNISTDRSWLTINAKGAPVPNGSIVFIHNNLHPQFYTWLSGKSDLILVCGIPETMELVRHL